MQVWCFGFLAVVFLCLGPARWIFQIWSFGCLCLPDVLSVTCFILGLLLNDIRRYQPAPSHTFKSLFTQLLFITFVRTLARLIEWRFDQLSRDSKKYQANFLAALLRNNHDTMISKDFGVQDVTSVEEFREKVPLTTYQAYRKYVDIISEENPAGVLFPEKADLIALTSGTTTGKSKGYPKSPVARGKIFMRWMLIVQRKIAMIPGMNKLKRWYLPHVCPKCPLTTSGLKTGPISTVLSSTLPSFVSVPKTDICTERESAYIGLLFSIQEPNLAYFGAPVASNILTICTELESNWESICDDIERGHVSADLDIPEADRQLLNRLLKKRPKRAQQLREEFKKGLQGIVPRIWPGLPGVFALTTGAFKTSAEILRQKYLGNIPIYSMIHVGTETLYGVNFDPLQPEVEYVAMIAMNFFEFIPEEEMESENPSTLLAHQVEVGKVYEIVITTYDGLYRYRTEDTIQITGFHNTVPKYKFMRRAGDILTTMTEKVPECILAEALHETAKSWKNGAIKVFTSVEGIHVEKVLDEFSGENYYVTFLEMQSGAQPSQEELAMVDEEIKRRHDVYCAMRNNRKLQQLRLFPVRSGTFDIVKQMMLDRNPDAFCLQLKMPRIIRTEDTLKILLESRL